MESIAFLFPGQGSQLVGMGHALYLAEPAAREVFAQADETLGLPLSGICFDGPIETLTDTINAQPAILTTSIAILRVLEQRTAVRPSFAAGHSLGEFTALVSAGALSFADAVRLVRERGRLMKAAGDLQPGGMVAVLGIDAAALTGICRRAQKETGQAVQIANDNCPGQIVISGARRALARASALAQEAGAKRTVPLQVSIPAHSPLMTSAAAEFEPLVAQVSIRPPVVPVIGNTTALPLVDTAGIRSELVSQLTQPVRWTETIHYLRAQAVDTLVEIGPGDVLTNLAKRIDRSARRFSIQEEQGIRELVSQSARRG